LRVTRLLVPTPVSPNALTLTMLVVGVAAAVVLAWPTWWHAAITAFGVQLYLLLDCVDGELARWRRTTSAAGVYLDRLGHHVVEAALLVALGVRAAGGPSADWSGWHVLGALAALVAVLGKVETDLVTVARAGAGLTPKDSANAASRHPGVRRARRAVARVPLHRMVGAVELSLVVIIAAIVDAVVGGLLATRFVLVVAASVGTLVAIGHPITILTSERLR
ncbi:MAG: CDP-alcohol phosphatidyltransferase family protein, partial [Nitriliruptoraceae bacterium]